MSLTESATFNDTSSYYVSKTGTSVAGVLSLNNLSGVLNLASSDSSITVAPSPGSIQLTTTGNPLAPSTITASGAVSCGTTLGVSGVSTLAGAVSCSSTLSTAGLASFNGGATVSAPFLTPSPNEALTISNALQTTTINWDGQRNLICSLPATNQTVGGAVVNITIPDDFNTNPTYAGRQIAKIFISGANGAANYTWNLVRAGQTTLLYSAGTGDGNAPNILEVQCLTIGVVTVAGYGVAVPSCAPKPVA